MAESSGLRQPIEFKWAAAALGEAVFGISASIHIRRFKFFLQLEEIALFAFGKITRDQLKWSLTESRDSLSLPKVSSSDYPDPKTWEFFSYTLGEIYDYACLRFNDPAVPALEHSTDFSGGKELPGNKRLLEAGLPKIILEENRHNKEFKEFIAQCFKDTFSAEAIPVGEFMITSNNGRGHEEFYYKCRLRELIYFAFGKLDRDGLEYSVKNGRLYDVEIRGYFRSEGYQLKDIFAYAKARFNNENVAALKRTNEHQSFLDNLDLLQEMKSGRQTADRDWANTSPSEDAANADQPPVDSEIPASAPPPSHAVFIDADSSSESTTVQPMQRAPAPAPTAGLKGILKRPGDGKPRKTKRVWWEFGTKFPPPEEEPTVQELEASVYFYNSVVAGGPSVTDTTADHDLTVEDEASATATGREHLPASHNLSFDDDLAVYDSDLDHKTLSDYKGELAAGTTIAALWLTLGGLIGGGVIAPGLVDLRIAMHVGIYSLAMVAGTVALVALAAVVVRAAKNRSKRVNGGDYDSSDDSDGDAATHEPEIEHTRSPYQGRYQSSDSRKVIVEGDGGYSDQVRRAHISNKTLGF